MEIPQDKSFYSRLPILFGIGIIVIGFFYFFYHQFNVDDNKTLQTVRADTIQTTVVKKTPFNHQVAAYGELKSSMEVVLISQVSGIISQLHFKPGSYVTGLTPVISLINPNIASHLKNAKFELEAATAQYALAKASIGEQEFKLVSDEKLALADVDILETELAARKSLADRKIISGLDFARVKQELGKAQLKHQLIQQRLTNFINNKPTKLKVIEFELANAKRYLNDKQTDFDNLKVAVTTDGVLQHLEESMKLGAWVEKGSKIGLIADTRQLYAQLEVNAADVAQLTLDMQVTVNIKGQQVKGVITRIAPNVVNNRVIVDANINQTLPATARPAVEVNATILANQIDSTLVIERPLNLNQQQDIELYVKQTGQSYYERRMVKTGAWSNHHIQVVAGIKENDIVVISNTDDWHDKVKSNGS